MTNPRISKRPHFSALRILAVSATWQGADDYAFVRAFRRLGHSVRVVPEAESKPLWHTKPMRALRRLLDKSIVSEYNARLLREVRDLGPDLLFVFKGPLVTDATLRAIQETGTLTIQFFPDTGLSAHSRYLTAALRHYDWVFSTKPNHPHDLARDLGIRNVSFVPHGFHPENHLLTQISDRDRADYACDIGFVGNISPKKASLMGHVVRNLPGTDIRIWGSDSWGNVEDAARAFRGKPVFGLEYAKANQLSRINLGLLFEGNVGGALADRITSRTFHIPASGGFMLHERTDEVLDLFEEGREIACFSDADELIAKIRYYLKHEDERKAIAEAGHARCLSSGYSIDDRAKTVITKYHEIRGMRDGNKPKRKGSDS